MRPQVLSDDQAPHEALEILAGADWGTDAFYQAVAPSGIVGVARLAYCLNPRTVTDDPWYVGDYGWVLDEFVPMPSPVPHKGAQGCWGLEPEALAQVREHYRLGRIT